MSQENSVRIVRELANRGYNADREAVKLLVGSENPIKVIDKAIQELPESSHTLSASQINSIVEQRSSSTTNATNRTGVSTADDTAANQSTRADTPSETRRGPPSHDVDTVRIDNDVTGQSTGTGVYEDFVATFRDRFERLAGLLRSRVTHRPSTALRQMSGGSEAAMIGMVSDIRSTANGHFLIELEDTAGSFPTLVSAGADEVTLVESLLLDEVIAVEGQLADDGGILFVDSIHFPDVPRTYSPSTADRHVEAALISDLHVGSQEFRQDAWESFANWLSSDEAAAVEYLLIAGDMVEGVGVYPDQEEELAIIDIYEQYRRFAEHLKAVPSDLEIIMIPGNHDAVRLAEPQPGFRDDLRDIMSVHDARITGNPSMVTIENVTVLMYHGTSLDELIAAVPSASYDEPHKAMSQLLRKRHLAPQYGNRNRLAPEERDYLVIDDVPDVFHAGHVHKLGVGRYHNVTTVNSSCWQSQTNYQRRVNLTPDTGYAPILELDTLEVTVRKFS